MLERTRGIPVTAVNPKAKSKRTARRGLGPIWEFISARSHARMVATSILRFDHFVSLEMDPEVETYDAYFESSIEHGDEVRRIVFDSRVTYRNKALVAHYIDHEAASGDCSTDWKAKIERYFQRDGVVYRLLNKDSIRANEVLLANNHKMIPWLRRPHGPISDTNRQVILGSLAGSGEAVPLGSLAGRTGIDLEVVVPVVIESYLRRQVGLDISVRPFGRSTLVALRESAA